MSLIIFHEFGHFFTAIIFNWHIDKIYIYPLGGVTKFKDDINKPIIEELLVTLMGPIFQILLASILIRYDNNIKDFNTVLLYFNLLPIIPLDGSKLLLITYSYLIPFKKALKHIIKVSIIIYFIVLSFILYERLSLFYIVAILLLAFKIIDEKQKEKYIYNKFLLERYIKKYNYKRTIMINKIEDIYKYKNNIINKNNRLYKEKDILEEYFKYL